MSEVTLYHGDCLSILPTLPDKSVDLVFTSPPYFNAREYSQYETYASYLEFIKRVANELHRVLKEGRFFVCNTSPVIEPRLDRQHQSKRYAIPFDIHPLICGAGFDFIDDIIWAKPEPSAKNRNAKFFQTRTPLVYKPNPVTEYVMVYRKHTERLIDWNLRQYPKDTREASRINGTYERSNIWEISPVSTPDHPAVFPVDLASKVISFYSFIGDSVLDPFSGIGTTALAAQELNRNFIGMEREQNYFEIAQRRIQEAQLQPVML